MPDRVQGRAGGDVSDAAVEAARQTGGNFRDILAAAHSTALGLDRSVCLRDVVEALRQRAGYYGEVERFADFIAREFGAES